MRIRNISKKMVSLALTIAIIGTGSGINALANSVNDGKNSQKSDDNKVTVVKELTDERTENSNTYLLSDGSKKTEIFLSNIRYEKDGQLKDYENENVKIIPYVDDMPSLMHATDLIVSRAGASTLAELTALGVPAILIPSPYVAANHQEYNARELENNHAAKMILEKDLTGEKLISTIDSVINDQTALQILTENAKKLGKPNAVEDMYQEIISMLGD